MQVLDRALPYSARMANFDNLAERLEYWLDLAAKEPDGSSAINAWSRVFGLQSSPEDRAECLRRCASVMDLAVQVRRQAELLPPRAHARLMMANFDQVERVVSRFTYVGSIDKRDFFTGMTPSGWQSLKLVSAMLSAYLPEKTLGDEEAVDFIGRAGQLRADIETDNSLSEDAKSLILSRLQDVIDALAQVGLTGAPGIETATDALITAVWRKCGGRWMQETSSGKKIALLVAAIALALDMGANTKALLPGTDTPPAVTQNVDVDVEINQSTIIVEPRDVGDVDDGYPALDPPRC